jgi:hypothetical protein
MLAKRQGLADWLDESRLPQIAEATAAAGTWNIPTLVAYRNMTRRSSTAYATPMLREWWNSDAGYSAADWAAKRRGDAARIRVTKAVHDAGAIPLGM